MDSINQMYRKLGFGGLVFGLHTDTGFANYVEPEYDTQNVIAGIANINDGFEITTSAINSFIATSGVEPITSPVDGLGYPVQDPRNPIDTVGFFKVTSSPSGTPTPAEFTSVRLSGVSNPQNSGSLGFFIASPKNQNFEATITILGDLYEVSSMNNYAYRITGDEGLSIIKYNGNENKNFDFILITTELTPPSGYVIDDTIESSSSSSSSIAPSASSSSSSNIFQIPILN